MQNKQNELPDYPIFMAIAEDIGYDATGKQTQVNELELISTELAEFIQERRLKMKTFELSESIDNKKGLYYPIITIQKVVWM